MIIERRTFLALTGAAVIESWASGGALQTSGSDSMYGLIGKVNAVKGQRDALAAILLEGTGTMPGCLSYVIATDPADADALWITEVWTDQASHRASLALPQVQAAIAKAKPI